MVWVVFWFVDVIGGIERLLVVGKRFLDFYGKQFVLVVIIVIWVNEYRYMDYYCIFQVVCIIVFEDIKIIELIV